MRQALVAALLCLLAACEGPRPDGLAFADPGPGPHVIFDLEARPLPEIPLPNDLATRADPDSPTGRRVNVSLDAPTRLERKLRRTVSRLEGFSTFGPVSVRFDAPLDLDNLTERHRRNRDFDDDAVLLVNLQPGSKRYGDAVLLDFDQGNFPLTVPEMGSLWSNDPRETVANLLFDTTNEDLNGNGRLDPGEDTDGDGLLDVPNVHPKGGHPIDDLLTFYEKVTDTLLLRPVVPLEQEARYAVVLTKRLVGEDGQPVRSPFPYVHHLRQTEELRGLPEVLERYGLTREDVAFAWTFTTQGPTRDLEALRRGLYGVGPFAHLAREFPPGLELVKSFSGEGQNPYRVPGARLKQLIEILGPIYLGGDATGMKALGQSFDNVAYAVVGEFTGPNLLADRDGHASPGHPADEDEVWDLDRVTGHAFYRPHRVPFVCTIPRADRGSGPPFPVAIYAHGYMSNRVENLLFSGHLARYGIASCTIDAYGHGLILPNSIADMAEGFFGLLDMKGTLRAFAPGRARDLDLDGRPDVGADFFSADAFHTRDMVRQTVLDLMVLIRTLRSFDGHRRNLQDVQGLGRPGLAGDLDGDGRVDLGGPLNDYFGWGTSMGGITTLVLDGIEPAIVAGAPSAGGGGLTSIPVRTVVSGVREAAILRSMGPVFVTQPGDREEAVDLATIVPSANRAVTHRLITNFEVQPGDRVELWNLTNGKSYAAYADANRMLRLHVPADAMEPAERHARLGVGAGFMPARAILADTPLVGDRLELRVFVGPSGPLRRTYNRFGEEVLFQGVTYRRGSPLVALASGLGLQRNTPEFRKLIAIGQMAIDAGDPVNYAPHYALDPLPSTDYDRAQPGASVCLIATAGDTLVPVASAVALGRASGAVEYLTPDVRFGKPANQVLIDAFVTEGLSWLARFDGREVLADPEDFSRGQHAPRSPRVGHPMRMTRVLPAGLQALRIPLLDPRGQHGFAFDPPGTDFDTSTFLIHMVAQFYRSRGRDLRDDPCMATASCPWIPAPSPPPPTE
ncbi:MAG: hypothetical protein IT371_04595 [Deltaproteobacteria bacterium]|nr:hypothetical protein [Deltaproteobacteria bacterium]